jgi:hypothetical protein
MADDTLLGIEPPEQIPEPFSLGPEIPQISADIADARAKKYHYGLDANSPGLHELRSSIMSQREPQERLQAAIREKMREQELRQERIRQYIQARGPGQVTQQEIDHVGTLATEQPTRDPRSIFEEAYAKRIVQEATKNQAAQVEKEAPGVAEAIQKGGEKLIAGKEIAQKKLEELEAEYQQMGTGAFIWDILETFVPGKSWYAQQNALGPGFSTSFLRGANKREQALAYYQLPAEQQEEVLTKAIAEIKSGNFLDALDFVASIVAYSSTNEVLDTIGSIADIGLIASVPIGATATLLKTGSATAAAKTFAKGTAVAVSPPLVPTAAKAAAKGTQALVNTVKDVVKASGNRTTTQAAVLEAGGDLGGAAKALAVAKLEQQAKTGNAQGLTRLQDEVPAIFNTEKVLTEGGTQFAPEVLQRMITTLNQNATKLANTLTDPLVNERLTPGSPSWYAALDEAALRFKTEYPHLSQEILSVRPRALFTREDFLAKASRLEKEIAKRGKEQEFYDWKVARNNWKGLEAKWRALNDDIADLMKPVGSRAHVETGDLEDQLKAFSKQFVDQRHEALLKETTATIKALTGPKVADRAVYMRAARNTFRAEGELPLDVPQANTGLKGVKGLGNVDYLALELGNKGKLFTSEAGATTIAKDIWGLKDFQVIQKGDGYYVQVLKALDETHPTVREALKIETANATPRSIANTIAGFLRSKEYTLPDDMSRDFVSSGYGASYMSQVLKEVTNPTVGKLIRWKKDEQKRFIDFIEGQRTYKNPTTGVPGKFSDNQGALEQEWMARFKQLPSESEALAYWSYVQLNNWDLVARNLGWYRDKSRKGMEMFSFPVNGLKWKQPLFEGKLHTEMPKIDQDFGVLVWDKDPAKFKYLRHYGGDRLRDEAGFARVPQQGGVVYEMGVSHKAEMERLMSDGYKLIQLTNFSEADLRSYNKLFGDKLPNGKIHFVLTRELDSAPLNFQQSPNRPGGHIEYQANHYVVQAKMERGEDGKRYYNGETVAFGFDVNAKGKMWTKRIEEGRKLYLASTTDLNKEAALAAYVDKFLPMWTVGEFKAKFKSGAWDPHEPFMMVGKSGRTRDLKEFKDHYRDVVISEDTPLNLYGDSVNLKYAGERGETLQTIAHEGTRAKPSYAVKDAPMLDAASTINSAATTLMRGRYLEDLKIRAVERFIGEFGNLLKTDPEALRSNPMKHVFQPDWIETTRENALQMAAARNYLRATKEFLHTKGEYQGYLDYVKQKIHDGIYKAMGEKTPAFVEKFAYRQQDPIQKLRNVTFHEHLGMFRPAQLLVQYGTFAHIAAVEGPVRAGKSLGAAAMSRWGIHEDDLATLTAWAGKVPGWKPEHWLESHNALKRTGFFHVGRETAMMDDFVNAKITTGKLGSFVETGTYFFKAGETHPRLVAWHAAYDRWRDANPTKLFDETAMKEVLHRAQLGVGDMSSAANATWQKAAGGIPGLTGQFATYQTRIWEQIFSNRLTPIEKGRVFLVNSVLFGVPAAAGIATLGYPLAKEFKKYLLEKGVAVDDNVVTQVMEDGIIAPTLEWATGTKFNIGERYGVASQGLLSDLFTDDKTTFEIMTGAAGTAMKNAWWTLYPFQMAIMSAFDSSRPSYNLNATHFKSVVENIGTISDASKAYTALAIGEYHSRWGQKIDDATYFQGIITALTGLQPQSTSDLYKIIANTEEHAANKRIHQKFISKYFQAALQSFGEGDTKQGEEYMNMVHAHFISGGFRKDEEAAAYQKASNESKALYQRVMEKYAKESPEKLDYFVKQLRKREVN